MCALTKVSDTWPQLKREAHQGNLTNYGKTTGRYVRISNSQSARRALRASSPQPIWAVAAGNRIFRQRWWHKKSRKCISLQDHVNLYQDIKVLITYYSIIGKPISGQDKHHHKVDGSRKLALRGVEGTLLLPSRQKTARWEHHQATQTPPPHTTAPIDFEKLQILEKCLGF